MYSFEPNEEQKMLTEAVYRYAFNDLRANAHTAEEEAGFAETLIEKGWELGYLQASISEDYGGFGERSAVTGVLALEEMSWGDLAGTLAVMAPNLFAVPIALVGSSQQKERFLPAIVAADWKPYTAAMIEPEFDFDPNELHTVAETSGESYLITGEKVYVPFRKPGQMDDCLCPVGGRDTGVHCSRRIGRLIDRRPPEIDGHSRSAGLQSIV